MDGWNTILSYWVSATNFRCKLAVSFRGPVTYPGPEIFIAHQAFRLGSYPGTIDFIGLPSSFHRFSMAGISWKMTSSNLMGNSNTCENFKCLCFFHEQYETPCMEYLPNIYHKFMVNVGTYYIFHIWSIWDSHVSFRWVHSSGSKGDNKLLIDL